jgi:hypothetical protein
MPKQKTRQPGIGQTLLKDLEENIRSRDASLIQAWIARATRAGVPAEKAATLGDDLTNELRTTFTAIAQVEEVLDDGHFADLVALLVVTALHERNMLKEAMIALYEGLKAEGR